MTTATAAGAKPKTRQGIVVLVVLLLLLGLPLAVWLDLRSLSADILRQQAFQTGQIIDDMRAFYASDVVARVLAAHQQVKPVHNYTEIDGAIPIPATLSIELGKKISAQNAAIKYRFVSDYPFIGREPHPLDGFETGALASLRANPKQQILEIAGTIFDRSVRMVSPVIMAQACVSCHNTHPESPKKDWKVGDVRGIQEITIQQPLAVNLWAFKYSLAYFVIAALSGLSFIMMQRRQATTIAEMNQDLTVANEFLASVSMKIARYLPPQIYKSVFSGQRDVTIQTERKKLTIFFSDIMDFTGTTERMQPEELTNLLNEYLTEMSQIALFHGGTIDKFIGDAMLVFFGDPETKGVAEDARACLLMAVDMQRRLHELNARWRQRGVELPFRARMGINTGYCNVGNFGSVDRMDYTIIGAEANLAARLQSIAEPNGIVLSYEAYSHVRDLIRAKPLAPISMKGIARPVVPYAVEGVVGELSQRARVISEHTAGVDVFVDLDVIDRETAARTIKTLQAALDALDAKAAKPSV
ncbi:MAG TPA: adenylate/guanylate cyclase domain-containing protein [Dongiaceae bacterium]|nr:adenylate/guanylate cyclase domain-containing protein [Dongiaceae bacterium]